MLALLGAAPDIDDKYAEARAQIQALKEEIRKKTTGQDDTVLQTQSRQEEKEHGTWSDAAPDAAAGGGGNNGNKQGLYKLQPAAAFKLRRKLPGHFGKIYALHWASNNEDIVSASQDGKLLIWNTATTNKKIAIPLRSAWVMTCAYSPCRRYVASGGLDNLCTIFNVKDSIGWDVNQPYRELQRHEGYLSCCRFVNDNQIMTSSGDASCILWDIDKTTAISSFVDHNGDVESVAICPNTEQVFVSGSIDAMAKVWDTRIGNNAVANFKGHESDINSVEWFPDGNAFISGSDDTTVRLFDLKAYKQLNIYCGEDILASVTSVGFSNSGYYLLVGYDEEPFCLAWNTMTCDREAQLDHPTRASCLQFSPNGYAIATGCWDRILRIWA